MNFIKKNKVLFITLVLSLLVSVYLVIEIMSQISRYRKEKANLIKDKKQIELICKSAYKPNKSNLDLINADIEKFEKLVYKTKQRFGKPYNSALELYFKRLAFYFTSGDAAAAPLDKSEGNKIKKNLKTQDAEDSDSESSDEEYEDDDVEISFEPREYVTSLFASWPEEVGERFNFRNNFYSFHGIENNKLSEEIDSDYRIHPLKLKECINIFCKEYNKISNTEKIDENASYSHKIVFLLDAMGLNRTVSEAIATRYLFDRRLEFFEFVEGKCLFDSSVEKFFHFNLDKTAIPQPQKIPYYIKQFDIVTDLFNRIITSKIYKVNDLRTISYIPVVEGDFSTYRYQMQLDSSLESLRAFINKLNLAVDDNRLWIIQYIEISDNIEDKDSKYEDQMLKRLTFVKDPENNPDKEKIENLLKTGTYASANVDRSKKSTQLSKKKNSKRRISSKRKSRISSAKKTRKTSFKKKSLKNNSKDIKKVPLFGGQKVVKIKRSDLANLDASDFPGYGKLIFGNEKLLKVKIVIDYVVFSVNDKTFE